jgi:hypothetical protein
MSGFFISAKSVKCEAKTKHLFLIKKAFFRELSNHNTKIVQIRK